jgi:carbonic anhydrase
MGMHRRELLGAAGGLVLGGLGLWLGQRLVTLPAPPHTCDAPWPTAPAGDVYTPDEALARLQAGNRRYVEGRGQVALPLPTPLLSRDHRPVAAVVTCSDSRLPAEAVFDERTGDLFVVRQPALLLEAGSFSALEYAVEYLRVPLILVLGHTHCAALNSALGTAEHPDAPPAGLEYLSKELSEVVKEALGQQDNRTERLLAANVRRVVRQLRVAPGLRDAIGRRVALRETPVLIQGASCDLASGIVKLIDLS